MWELNRHCDKFKGHGSRFQDIIEKKSHGLRMKAINILSLTLKVTKLATLLERNESLRCRLI